MTHTDSDDVRLSRRSILGALGAVGATTAGAGFVTTAYFVDEERFPGTLAAGELDLKLGYTARYVVDRGGSPRETTLAERPAGLDDWAGAVTGGRIGCESGALLDGTTAPAVELSDLKPGDRGRLTASIHLCGNPAYLSARVRVLASTDDRSGTDALEAAAGDRDAAGELEESIRVRLYADPGCDGSADGRLIYPRASPDDPASDRTLDPDRDARTIRRLPTLADLARDSVAGLLVDGDLLAGGSGDGPVEPARPGAGCLTLEWWLPLSTGNEAVTDTVRFDLAVGAVQARHNGSPAATGPFANDTASPDADGTGGSA
jgi:hypothetical protein